MLRATAITRHFHHPAGRITLDEAGRHRRRMKMAAESDAGPVEFLLDLPQTVLLRHGDGLLLEDGRVIEVFAAPEPLYEVRGHDSRHLLALAWQIGNRHLAAQIAKDHILIRRDAVIRDMLVGLGATVTDTERPFDPEGGAYGGHHQGHDHGHSHREHDHQAHDHQGHGHHEHDGDDGHHH